MPNATGASTASVIVPARNRLVQLIYTLESLRYQDAPASSYEVVVIDDASEEGVTDWLSAYPAPYRLVALRNDRRLGRAATRNRGLDAASGDVAVFLDGDKLCPPCFVSAHLRLHAEYGAGGAATCVSGHPWSWRTVPTVSFDDPFPRPLFDPALLSRWEDFQLQAGVRLGDPRDPVALAGPEDAAFVWFVASACSLRRAVAVELGGFDERFRGYGFEDWELGYRLQRRGARFVAHPAAAAFHQAHPPADRGPGDVHRNLRLFLDLHPDFEVALVFLHVPGTDGRYERLYTAYRRLARVAPALAGALREVAVDHARAFRDGEPAPARPPAFWVARWGPERLERIDAEQVAAIDDDVARPSVSLFQRLTGIVPSGGHGVRGRLGASPARPAGHSVGREVQAAADRVPDPTRARRAAAAPLHPGIPRTSGRTCGRLRGGRR